MSKPFNLEAALAGEPVETRDGRKVTEIYYFKTCTSSCPVTAVIEGDMRGYTVDGKDSWDNSNNTLVMASKKHQVWHCIFKKTVGTGVFVSAAYPTEEALLERFSEGSLLNYTTVKIYCTEWEE